jgi:hypothetical protein
MCWRTGCCCEELKVLVCRQDGQSAPANLRQICASWRRNLSATAFFAILYNSEVLNGPRLILRSAAMATPDAMAGKHKLDEPASVPRKRFKASELPLTSTQKSSIDSILHTIKKKGEYDTLRKKVWSQFAESVRVWTRHGRPRCAH